MFGWDDISFYFRRLTIFELSESIISVRLFDLISSVIKLIDFEKFQFILKFQAVKMDFMTIIVAVVVIFYFWYRHKYNRLLTLSSKIPGPPGLPILGNALSFFGKSPPEILQVMCDVYNEYSPHNDVACVRIGLAPLIMMVSPKNCELLLSSQKFLDKSDEYKSLMRWLSTGLLTSTGRKWFSRRKVITPAFHFKILEQFVEVFDRNSRILVDKFATTKGQSTDIFPLVTLCALDVICGKKKFALIRLSLHLTQVCDKSICDVTERALAFHSC